MPDRRRVVRVAAAAAGLAAALLLTGCAARPAAPAPLPSPVVSGAALAKAAGPQDPVAASAAPSPTATPVRIRIPSIGVDASLERLVRDGSGVLLPPHELMQAGWYAAGTVPGAIGPAVIAGHVDWVKTIAVFHRLKELVPGAEIDVVLSDRSTVRFTVDDVRTVSKFHFPTSAVYGPTPDPELRVITCGGPWDDARNIYSDNVVVFAHER